MEKITQNHMAYSKREWRGRNHPEPRDALPGDTGTCLLGAGRAKGGHRALQTTSCLFKKWSWREVIEPQTEADGDGWDRSTINRALQVTWSWTGHRVSGMLSLHGGLLSPCKEEQPHQDVPGKRRHCDVLCIRWQRELKMLGGLLERSRSHVMAG